MEKKMIRKLGFVWLLLAVWVLGGCSGSGSLMQPSPAQELIGPQSDQAQVVFMRTSIVAGAITAELFEVVDGELKFIGALPTGKKIVHKTSPGKHIYMAYGTAADFMLANVEGGKTYYSIVRPNWATGGFAPTPVRTDGNTDYNTSIAEFKKWRDGTKLLEVKDQAKANAWFAANREKLQEIYKNYWARFQQKDMQQKAERTLNPQDGLAE
jgi:hypothetical protein